MQLIQLLHARMSVDVSHIGRQTVTDSFFSVKAPSSASWTILSQLNGCPCCLKNTKSVTECFIEGEGCGPSLCNCNDADPACLVSGAAHSLRMLCILFNVPPCKWANMFAKCPVCISSSLQHPSVIVPACLLLLAAQSCNMCTHQHHWR